MNWACPNCQRSWNWPGENEYWGGSIFECPGCKAISQIYLYCPRCKPNPDPKKDSDWLDTPDELLGGRRFTCGACGTGFTVQVTAEEVHKRLQSWGTQVGRYHQNEHIKKIGEDGLRGMVSGGMCKGIALDWIRRALVANKTVYDNDKARQDVRGARAWVESSAQKVNPFLQNQVQSLNNQMQQNRQTEQNNFNTQKAALDKKINEAYDKISKANLPMEQRREMNNKVRAIYDKEMAQLQNNRDTNIANFQLKAQATANGSIMERFWDQFTRVMDDYMAKDRLRRGKSGGPSHAFSQLIVVKSVDADEMPGVAHLADSLIGDRELSPNRAALVSISPPTQGAVGHAISIWRQNTGKYVMFEPNFGTFELNSGRLRESVVYLFRQAYPNMGGGGTSDNHAYEIGGKIRGGYTIFEGVRESVPTVVQLPSITNITEPRNPPPPRLSPMKVAPKWKPGKIHGRHGRPIIGLHETQTTTSTTTTGTKTTGTTGKFKKPVITPPKKGGIGNLFKKFGK